MSGLNVNLPVVVVVVAPRARSVPTPLSSRLTADGRPDKLIDSELFGFSNISQKVYP